MACPNCGGTDKIIGREYAYGSPERYDGISEYWCGDCATRWGRWTKRILQPGELEPRLGGSR